MTSDMTVRYRSGYAFGGVPAATAAAELARIAEADGGVRARRVVEVARAPDHPLHAGFEWDDQVAGERYRVVQARTLMRAIIHVESEETSERHLYVHVRTAGESEGSYQPLLSVVADEYLYEQAIAELNHKFLAARRALDELEEVASRAGKADRLAAIALAAKGFDAVRETLRVLARP